MSNKINLGVERSVTDSLHPVTLKIEKEVFGSITLYVTEEHLENLLNGEKKVDWLKLMRDPIIRENVIFGSVHNGTVREPKDGDREPSNLLLSKSGEVVSFSD